MASPAELAFSGIIEFADATYKRYVEALEKMALELDRRLLAEVRAIPVDARGRFQRSPNTLARLREIQVRLVHHLAEAGFPMAQRELVDSYPELAKRTERAWKLSAGSKTGFLQEDLEAFRALTGAQLDQFANVGVEGARLIQQELQRAVLGESSYADLSTKLRDMLLVHPELVNRRGGGMWRHAATLADTSLSEMQRFMNLKIGNRVGVERFRYFGPLDQVTRPFCQKTLRARRPPIYTRDEIAAMDNEQTAEGSVLIAAGGYNCRHIWIPVVEAKVEEGEEPVSFLETAGFDRELTMRESLGQAIHLETERFRRAFSAIDETLQKADRAILLVGSLIDAAGRVKVVADVASMLAQAAEAVLPPGSPYSALAGTIHAGADITSDILSPFAKQPSFTKIIRSLAPLAVEKPEIAQASVFAREYALAQGLKAHKISIGQMIDMLGSITRRDHLVNETNRAVVTANWLGANLVRLHREADLLRQGAVSAGQVFKAPGIAAKSEALADAIIYGTSGTLMAFEEAHRLAGVSGAFLGDLTAKFNAWRRDPTGRKRREVEDLIDAIRLHFGIGDDEPVGLLRDDDGTVHVYAMTPRKRPPPLREKPPLRYSDLEIEGALRQVQDVGDDTVLNDAQRVAVYKISKAPVDQVERVMRETGVSLSGQLPIPAEPGVVQDHMIVYHASPYDFREFSAAHMLKGEGSMAFARGHYTAENAAVGRSYMPAPATPITTIDIDLFRQGTGLNRLGSAAHSNLDRAVLDARGDLHKASEILRKWISINERELTPSGDELKDAQSNETRIRNLVAQQTALKAIEAGAVTPGTMRPGHLYEVKIHAPASAFLDWDETLQLQSPRVKAALLEFLDDHPDLPQAENIRLAIAGQVDLRHLKGTIHGSEFRGGSLYSTLMDYFVSLEPGVTLEEKKGVIITRREVELKLTNELRKVGIPGVRFLDEGSRGMTRQLIPEMRGVATLAEWQDRARMYLDTPMERRISEVIYHNRNQGKNIFTESRAIILGIGSGNRPWPGVTEVQVDEVIRKLTMPPTRNVIVFHGEERLMEIVMVNERPVEVLARKTYAEALTDEGATITREVADALGLRAWAEQMWLRHGDADLVRMAAPHAEHEGRMLALEIVPDMAQHLKPYDEFYRRLQRLSPEQRLAVTEQYGGFLLSEIQNRLGVPPARVDFGFGTWGVEPNPSAAFYFSSSAKEVEVMANAYAWAAKQAQVWTWSKHQGGMAALEAGKAELGVRIFDTGSSRLANSAFRLKVYNALNEELGGILQGFSPALVEGRHPGIVMVLTDNARDTVGRALREAAVGRNHVTEAIDRISARFGLDLRIDAEALRLRKAVIDWTADPNGVAALSGLRKLGRGDVADWLVRELRPRAEARFASVLAQAEAGTLERFVRTRSGVALATLPNVADRPAAQTIAMMYNYKTKTRAIYWSGHVKAGQPLERLSLEGLPPKVVEKAHKVAAEFGFTYESAKEQYNELMRSALKRQGVYPLLRIRDQFYYRFHYRLLEASVSLGVDFQKLAATTAAISPDAAGDVNDLFAIDLAYFLKRNDVLSGERLAAVNRGIYEAHLDAIASAAKHQTLSRAATERAELAAVRERVSRTKKTREKWHDIRVDSEAAAVRHLRFSELAMAESRLLDVKAVEGQHLASLDTYPLVHALQVFRQEEYGAGFTARRGFANYRKAVDILLSRRTIDDALRDEKVRAFANNIIDPWGMERRGIVTIDFHMINAAARALGADKITTLMSTPKYMGVNLGVRAMLADVVREVAAEWSVAYGEYLSPLRVQEIIWNEWKRRTGELGEMSHPPPKMKRDPSLTVNTVVPRALIQAADDETVRKPFFSEIDAKTFIAYRAKAGKMLVGERGKEVLASVYLSPTTAQEFMEQGTRLFYWADQSVGFALSKTGDIQNVFNASPTPGVGAEAILYAIENGGKTLDCYEGFLPNYYRKFGFVETGRLKWDDQYTPKGWDFEKQNRPDVVMMEYRGGDPLTLRYRYPWGGYVMSVTRKTREVIIGKGSAEKVTEIVEEVAGYATADRRAPTNAQAIAEFGLTDDFREAGYILSDGSLLDFSGKSQGGPAGKRAFDHREISRAEGSEGGRTMEVFQETRGAIRFMPEMESGAFDMRSEPTEAQLRTIAGIVREREGEVIVEVWRESDDSSEYKLFDAGTNPGLVTDFIRRFYEAPPRTRPAMDLRDWTQSAIDLLVRASARPGGIPMPLGHEDDVAGLLGAGLVERVERAKGTMLRLTPRGVDRARAVIAEQPLPASVVSFGKATRGNKEAIARQLVSELRQQGIREWDAPATMYIDAQLLKTLAIREKATSQVFGSTAEPGFHRFISDVAATRGGVEHGYMFRGQYLSKKDADTIMELIYEALTGE